MLEVKSQGVLAVGAGEEDWVSQGGPGAACTTGMWKLPSRLGMPADGTTGPAGRPTGSKAPVQGGGA